MSASTPASEFVTDTVGLVLRIEKRRMGTAAKAVFDAAELGNATIYIPALVFAEILYLAEKNRIGITLNDVAAYLRRYPNYREQPMSLAVVQSAAQITDIRELHDRLIAGAARLLGLELLTNDAVIRASAFVKTVW